MAKLIGVVLVAFIALGSGARAFEYHGLDDFSPSDREQIRELGTSFAELSKSLTSKLRKFEDGLPYEERMVALAKKEQSKMCSGVKCLSLIKLAMISPSKNLRERSNRALALFASLADTVGFCDRKSYEILAKNYIAHDSVGYVQNKPRTDADTKSVVRYYRKRHAEFCLPKYKTRIAERINNVSLDDLKKLDETFAALWKIFVNHHETDDVAAEDFDRQPLLLSINQPVLDARALRALARQVADPHDFRLLPSEKIVSRIESQVIEPCKRLRNELGTVLDEARFYAGALAEDLRDRIVHEDERVYRSMVNNRLCGSLLRVTREKMMKAIDDRRQELYENKSGDENDN